MRGWCGKRHLLLLRIISQEIAITLIQPQLLQEPGLEVYTCLSFVKWTYWSMLGRVPDFTNKQERTCVEYFILMITGPLLSSKGKRKLTQSTIFQVYKTLSLVSWTYWSMLGRNPGITTIQGNLCGIVHSFHDLTTRSENGKADIEAVNGTR